MTHFLRDLRFAARSLRKSPGFTAVTLATLTLGIGANTAIFSVVDAVLLRPLPCPEPDRVMAVFQANPSQNVPQNGVSFLNYRDFASRTGSFESLAASRMHDFTLTGRGDPELIVGLSVTSNMFAVFRAKPLLGRVFEPRDDALGSPPVAVLGERLWRERFNADPGVVGKSVNLDDAPFTVVGVVSNSLQPPPANPRADLWVPLAQDPVFADLEKRRGGHYLRLIGRLRRGVAPEAAQAELSTVAAALARDYPKENTGWEVRVVPLAETVVRGVRTALLVLLAAVGLVFLIACANVANLLLVRSGARGREVAIRTALGADRARLLRQFLTESLVLGLAGGALGVALAVAGVRGLRAWLPSDLPRLDEIALDSRVLLFSLAASLVSAFIFGLAPALDASKVDLNESLKEGSMGAGESGGRRRTRNLLVIGETAFSFILLIGAGLLGRSFLRLQQVDLGFNPSHVLTAGMSLPRTKYSKPEQWLGFYGPLVDRLKAQPGVDSVTAALPLPLSGGGLNFGFQVEGRAAAAGADQSANYTAVLGDYFRVLGVRLVSGRLLDERDARGTPNVCLISSAFARQYFPDENPLGKRLVFGFVAPVPREIVGIVADVKRDDLSLPSRPEMYVPFAQDAWWAAYVAIRLKDGRDPLLLASALREQVRSLDPEMPVTEIQPFTQTVSDSVAEPRFRTTLLALFGATALLLAVIGIYGVISYTVGRRTREVGIRMTLGASATDVMRLVLRQGIGLTAAGLAVGVAGALLLTRSLSTLLFEVSPLDVPTWTAVAAVLIAAGLAACWIPARRAMRLDPVRALRHD